VWRSHPVKLWFRLTFLLASLTGMATTIVAEEGARCGVVGMIELGVGRAGRDVRYSVATAT
jgi:hypothetical protein